MQKSLEAPFQRSKRGVWVHFTSFSLPPVLKLWLLQQFTSKTDHWLPRIVQSSPGGPAQLPASSHSKSKEERKFCCCKQRRLADLLRSLRFSIFKGKKKIFSFFGKILKDTGERSAWPSRVEYSMECGDLNHPLRGLKSGWAIFLNWILQSGLQTRNLQIWAHLSDFATNFFAKPASDSQIYCPKVHFSNFLAKFLLKRLQAHRLQPWSPF